MHNFEESTLHWLATQGWTDSRQVETEGYVEALNAAGYDVPDSVEDFLRSFGGLTLEFRHHRVPTETDTLRVEPDEVSEFGSGRAEEYSRRVGAPLCPVGLVHSDHMVALMSPDGRVYAGFDYILAKLGDSPVEAIESHCFRGERPVELVPE